MAQTAAHTSGFAVYAELEKQRLQQHLDYKPSKLHLRRVGFSMGLFLLNSKVSHIRFI